MKHRLGFVSNSSAASFCVYGWSGSWTEMEALKEKINAQFPNFKLLDCAHPCDSTMLGVGNYEQDIDHWIGENWENYECPGPSKEEMEALDKIAEELGLPAPMMDSGTWFNG